MSGMNETPKGNRTHIAAVGCEVSRVGRSTVYNRTPSFPCSAAISPLTAEENGKIRSMRCFFEGTMLC